MRKSLGIFTETGTQRTKRSFSYIGSIYIALLSLDYLWELHGLAINSGNIFYPKITIFFFFFAWVFIKHYEIFVGIYELLYFMSEKKKMFFFMTKLHFFNATKWDTL